MRSGPPSRPERALPPERRHPVFLYVDELQSLSSLPFSLEYLFERARGLGCGVTVATQALMRLPESTRSLAAANVGQSRHLPLRLR